MQQKPSLEAVEKTAEKAVTPIKDAASVVTDATRKFADLQASSGIALVSAAVLALLASNSPVAHVYDLLLTVPITIQIADYGIDKPLLYWINDGLMAVFFFGIGLELKREFREGQLAKPSQIALPLGAAIGGMAVPAGVYVAINAGDPLALRGWAIPVATDIAFALGVLALLGPRIPSGLRVFLLTFAIFDDVGSIAIIALVFTENLSVLSLSLAVSAFFVLVILNLAGVSRVAAFILVGIALWLFVLKSGVHATIAGVLLGLTIPMRAKPDHRSPLIELENSLNPWIVFCVMPVFAFANAGIRLTGLSLESFLQPITLGIIIGLVLGKALGIAGGALLFVRLGWAHLPERTNYQMVCGVGILGGIGFTMSLLLAALAFEDTSYAASTRLGILAGTLLSALLGFAVLRLSAKESP